MTRLRLLVAESGGFSPRAASVLNDAFQVSWQDLDRRALVKQVPDFDLLWVRLRHKIDSEVLRHTSALRAIATNTTGLTHIDLDYAREKGIDVISLRGEEEFLRDIRATAEHTIGLTLSLIRHIPSACQSVCEGDWDRNRFQGSEIYQKTVGIIGYGRLGRIVARYFLALGAQVIVSSRDAVPGNTIDGMEVYKLDELLGKADIVSLHASFEPTNHHMIASREFALMREGAIFINTARGELVDESALADAIKSGRLSGAAIDVIENEHEPSKTQSELIRIARSTKRLLVTPHIGGNTIESTARTEDFLAEKLVKQFRSE